LQESVYLFHAESKQWSKVECEGFPSARFAHAAISFTPAHRSHAMKKSTASGKGKYKGKSKEKEKEKEKLMRKDKGKEKDKESAEMMLVFGGYDRRSSFADVWTFDPRA
jgi:hypothetical protein